MYNPQSVEINPFIFTKKSKMDKIFKYASGRVHYTDSGDGQVVMLIHGYLETTEVLSGFAKKMAEKFRVISVDLPGHGESVNTEKILTMEFMASILAKLIQELKIEKIFLTGHSLGGYVTLAFAELYPDMLSGYCLLHSHPFADDKEKIEKRNIEIGIVEKGKKDFFIPGSITKLYAAENIPLLGGALKHTIDVALRMPDKTIVSILKGMIARPSRVAVMESGRVPFLWILGASDNLINCEEVQSKIKMPQNSKIVVLHNSGHMGFIEEEERSVEIISEFVDKIY